MVTLSFNHIQGKNGSHWNRLIREEQAKEYYMVAIDAAKYVNTAMVCTIYGDILQEPFEFNESMTGYQLMKKHIDATCEAYSLSQVIVGIKIGTCATNNDEQFTQSHKNAKKIGY